MPLSVRVLFFAGHRDLVGTKEVPVEVPEGSSVRDLVTDLRTRGHPFSELPGDPSVAVNRVYVTLDTPLGSGDEVAFIPPVAGG